MKLIKKLDLYVLKNFFTLFSGTFCICLFVVMMQFLWRFVDELVGKGLGMGIIAELFFYAGLTLVPLALPLAILLASLLRLNGIKAQHITCMPYEDPFDDCHVVVDCLLPSGERIMLDPTSRLYYKDRYGKYISLPHLRELLIADEPTTALDVTIQAQVLLMMKELRDRINMPMILITHDLGVVAQTCDKVAVMYAGEIIETGTLEDIFTGSRHHPYTEGLFGSIPKINDKRPRLAPIPGMMPDPTKLPEGCHFADRCPHCTERCRKEHPKYSVSGSHRICCHLYEEGKHE